MGNQRLPDDGPAIGVDGRGTVLLAWRTVIGGADPEGALFYASTSDGRTFTPESESPRSAHSIPTPAACRRWPRANRGGVG